MLQILPREKTICLNTNDSEKAVGYIKSYIHNTNCEYVSFDVSGMNVFDACYVSAIGSAEHYLKYPNGKIEWHISSEIIKELNQELELGNTNYIL